MFRYPPVSFLSKNFTTLGIFPETFPTEKKTNKSSEKRKKKNNGGKEKQKHQEGEKEGEEVSLF